jgi:hypothetical protein
LVGLGPPQSDYKAIARKGCVRYVQTDELASAEGSGESDQQQSTVANAQKRCRNCRHHLAKVHGQYRVLSMLGGAMCPSNTGKDRPHSGIFGRRWMAGNLVSLAYCRQTTLKCADLPFLRERCQVHRERLG